MRYEDFTINQAIGAVLPNDIVISGKVYRKGHIITPDDKLLLKSYGVENIYGAVAESGDIEFNKITKFISKAVESKDLSLLKRQAAPLRISILPSPPVLSAETV